MKSSKKTVFLREIEIRYRRRKSVGKIVGRKVTGPDVIVELFADLENEGKEKFIAINLDASGKIACFEVVAIGSVHAIYLRPFEVFRSSIVVNASALIVVHNHPSGDVKPSSEDIMMTDRLAETATTMGLPFYDHIIVGAQKRYYSFAEAGRITFNPKWKPKKTSRKKISKRPSSK